MTAELALPLLMRWIHVGMAIVLVGGLIFYRLVFIPVASKVLSEEEQEKLRVPLMRRWKMYIHPPIILFLISGFYNYIFITSGNHVGQGLYHALFGMKFLLALCVFALGIIMTSTLTWSEKLRKNQALWSILLVLAVAVALIGGYMKVMPQTTPEPVPVEARAASGLPEVDGL